MHQTVCNRMSDLEGSETQQHPASSIAGKEELAGQRPCWRDWILHESKRRQVQACLEEVGEGAEKKKKNC